MGLCHIVLFRITKAEEQHSRGCEEDNSNAITTTLRLWAPVSRIEFDLPQYGAGKMRSLVGKSAVHMQPKIAWQVHLAPTCTCTHHCTLCFLGLLSSSGSYWMPKEGRCKARMLSYLSVALHGGVFTMCMFSFQNRQLCSKAQRNSWEKHWETLEHENWHDTGLII